MARGYEVYRAVSSQSSCDLIAQKADRLLRLEVRTGHYQKDGVSISFPKRERDRKDHYAVVLPDMVIYIPPLLG